MLFVLVLPLQNFLNRKPLIGEFKLELLAHLRIRRRKHHHEVRIQEIAQSTDKTPALASNIGALDGQLVINGLANPHER